jgi:predicted enzyme related to lactoylglutathione lyase
MDDSRKFYTDFLGFDLAMDMGWILTFVSPDNPTAQVTLLQPSTSDTPNPNVSIEVEDVDALHEKAVGLGLEIVYPLTDEPWGIRRFFVKDPNGAIINVVSHREVATGRRSNDRRPLQITQGASHAFEALRHPWRPVSTNSITMIIRTLILLLIIAAPVLAVDVPVRVGIFRGEGAGRTCEKLIAALQSAGDGAFAISRPTAEEIREGKLAAIDVLVHPGGSGSKQGQALGEEGRRAVREYVRGGGGYLGVCAGAYLATNDYSWSLDLIDAKVVDRRHWDRGKGTVGLRLSPQGAQFFQRDGREMEMVYAQGPLLGRREWDDPQVPDYESLAIFATEIAKNGAPRGVMAGTSAAVRSQYGAGRVFCFSPHPESTKGLEHLIPLAVEWLAEGKPRGEAE